MYYDMQSDRIYDNESAMEGILGKFKERREAKIKQREENAKEVRARKEKAVLQLKSAVPIIKKWVNKAKSNSKWKNLPFADMVIHDEGTYLFFNVFKDDTVVIDIGVEDNYIPEAEECFNFLYESIKKEIESSLPHLRVDVYESNEICIDSEK